MTRPSIFRLLGTLALLTAAAAADADRGDPQKGAQAFRQCAACHSLEPDQHLTGPSLSGVVDRPAGSAPGFTRYSEALAKSGLTWDVETLNRWLAGPSELVPETSMRVPPIDDPTTRRDIISFLESAQGGGGDPASSIRQGVEMMGGRHDTRMLNLKEPTETQRITSIGYCGDAYRVTLDTGKTYTFWEFNLRFKTDSSDNGPRSGAPAVVRAGMMGDRAQIVFAAPAEISAFIRNDCPSE